jgi:Protein of unknown function (DUF732)
MTSILIGCWSCGVFKHRNKIGDKMTENNNDEVVDFPPTGTQIGLPVLAAHAYSAEPAEQVKRTRLRRAPQTPPKQSWRNTSGLAMIVLFTALAVSVGIVALWIVDPSALITSPTTSPSVISADSLPSIDSGPPPAAAFDMPTGVADHMVDPKTSDPTLPACSSDGCDNDFLALLRRKNFVIYDAPVVISNAHLICANLAVTHNIYQTYLYVRDTLGSNDTPGPVHDETAKGLTSAAITIYCPNLAN